MSCSGDSNGNGGIRVRRDTLVTVEDCCEPHDGSASPVTTTIRSREPSVSRPQRSRHRSFPSFSGSANLKEMLRPDASSRRRPKTTEGDITEELIRFFRETPPPPGNPMSAPGLVDEKLERNGRRLPFWPFRRKGKKRDNKPEEAPGLIKLPDSAVAGTTTDGHRHIAISIPIEYDHLEPANRSSATPRTVPPTDAVSGEQAKEEDPEAPEDRDGGGTNYVTSTEDDTPCLPRRSSKRGAQQETAEPSQPRSENASVGAHNMIPNPCRELTAVQKGPACIPVAVANVVTNQSRSLRHQPVIRPISADSDRLPDGSRPRPTDPNLHKRPSNPESSGASSSELIFSDAETVYIPSPQSSTNVSTSSESSTYYTPELGQSPRDKSSWDTAGEGESENSSAVSNFSAPYNPSTSRTSSIPEFALAHPTFLWPGFHQPHALSAITSSGSIPSSARQDPATFSIAPIVTLADYQPSSPSPFSSSNPSSGAHHPPQDSATASAAHGSLTPTSTSTTTTTSTNTNPYQVPSAPDSHHHHQHYILPAGPAPPLPPRSPRRRTTHNHNLHHHHQRSHGHGSATSLLTMTHTREREMHALMDRLERLARANERWLSALQPVFERALGSGRVGSRLMMMGGGDGGIGGIHGGSVGGGVGGRPSGGSLRLEQSGGGGGSLGGRRRGSSSSSCSSSSNDGLGSDLVDGRGRRRVTAQAPSPSIRLRRADDGENLDAISSEVARTGHNLRLHAFDGYRLGSGEVNDGLHPDGHAGGINININDESWLRSDSGSANCSPSMSGALVLDGDGRGRWRSGESLREARGWRATFAGRQAEAFARDQRRRHRRDEYLDDLDNEVAPGAIEDPSGWDNLETLMRDLVLGSQRGDESIEGSTLFG